LRELREIAGKAQLDVAAALHIKQPSVSKVKKRLTCICQRCVTTSKLSAESLS
jgi:predicted XRE-type DNA-binding protein